MRASGRFMKRSAYLLLFIGMAWGLLSWNCSRKSAADFQSNSSSQYGVNQAGITELKPRAIKGYLFRGKPGEDVTIQLQKALNNHRVVYIDNRYILSNSIIIRNRGELRGLKNAALQAASTRKGLLNTRGVYILLEGKKRVSISGIRFMPAANMYNMASYGSTVILLSNSSHCTIDRNQFDFAFSYSKGMNAVWVTTNSNRNIISNNFVKTLGITYCENGSSFNVVEGNKLINSSFNALGGIGNGDKPCRSNKVLNNYVENAGRMGIEDIQNTSGTLIKGNVISGTGKIPNLGRGLGMGISAVAKNTTVEKNKVWDAKSYYIEVRGNSNIKVLDNEIYDKGTERGIYINFVGPSSSALADQGTIIRQNKIEGCLKAIETFGDGVKQIVDIDKNLIVNPVAQGINIDLRGLIRSSITIRGNRIVFYHKTNANRQGIVTYTTVKSGHQEYSCVIDGNFISYKPAAKGGSGYDIAMIIQTDHTVVSNNTIDGYPGGLNQGIASNGSTTRGISFSGNQVKHAAWDITQFPGKD